MRSYLAGRGLLSTMDGYNVLDRSVYTLGVLEGSIDGWLYLPGNSLRHAISSSRKVNFAS